MENQEQAIPGVDDELPAIQVPDALTAMKAKADLMGLSYHPNIGLDTLRDRVNAALAGEPAKQEQAPVVEPVVTPVAPAAPVQAYQAASLAPVAEVPVKRYVSPKAFADEESLAVEGESIAEKRMRLKRHALALVRIRVTNMNPLKKEWEGEIIAAGNGLVGTVKKYVPFAAEDGWHVPRILYNVLRDRMCQVFYTVTDPVSKQKVRKGRLIKEFAIDVLEPLTPEELAELAARQAANRSIDA